MNESLRGKIRESLISSYKHKHIDGVVCYHCCKNDRAVSFVLEKSFSEDDKLPYGFVHQSTSLGRHRGSYAFCDICAPPCKKCGLPIVNELVLEDGYKLQANVAVGVCRHLNLKQVLVVIFKRAFRLGRFKT